jgi:SAM-dependent methyltransferase
VFDARLTEYVEYPFHLARLKWIWETIERQRPKDRTVHILDIGCGTGNITIPLGTIENSQVLGIDIHNPTLEIARRHNPLPNVAFRHLRVEECDIRSFDVFVMTEVLEHIPAYLSILTYLARHMRSDARLLITIPNGRGPFELSQIPVYLLRRLHLHALVNRVKHWLGKEEPYSQNYDTPHVNFFTLPRLSRELRPLRLMIRQVRKAFVLLPIIETYLPFFKMPPGLVRFDERLAQRLPPALVSGWYLYIQPAAG